MSTVQFSLIIAEAGSTREPHQHLVLLNQSRTRSLLASLEMLATSTVLMMSKARDGKVQVQVQKSSKKNLLYKVQSSTGHDTGQDKNTSRNDSKKSEYKDVQICTTDLKIVLCRALVQATNNDYDSLSLSGIKLCADARDGAVDLIDHRPMTDVLERRMLYWFKAR